MTVNLERAFRRVVALRTAVLVLFGLLAPFALWLAAGISSDAGISRLVVPSDPDYLATQAFEKIFPENPIVIFLVEARDPFRPETLRAFQDLESDLKKVPGVSPYSALDVYEEAHPGATLDASGAPAVKRFLLGTSFFRRQGLMGDGFLGLVLSFKAPNPPARDATLAAIDKVADAANGRDGIERVRRVGAPYVESWIEHESSGASVRYFPIFALFVVGFALFLYRSFRTLLALLIALASSVLFGVAAGQLLGFGFTVVSALVPLTILVTTMANLVYLQSRYVDQPEGSDIDEHQAFALANKFLPVTASTLAAVLGFAALSVSSIRPIREMGLWTATGLALSWVTVFTLFPALQKALRTPTVRSVQVRSRYYDQLSELLPGFTFRLRHWLVPGSIVLAVLGFFAVAGVPGWIAPMKVGVDSLDYVDPKLPIHRDMLYYRDHVGGLNVARLWVTTKPGALSDPDLLRGLDRFMSAIEALPDVSSVVGPTSFLRMRRYIATGKDALPTDRDAFAALASDLESLLLTQPELRAFLDPNSLANAQLTVTFKGSDAAAYRSLEEEVKNAWNLVASDPAFRGVSVKVVGESLLQAKVGSDLVPTLAESFALTAVLIFAVFLVVFRSASARLMAMIPSVFAILVTFLFMRLTGTPLNVATILIATTVLGTTENDQIHFFHHLNEGEKKGDLEVAMRYALRVSGRAIVFATFINAAGFLGLAFSNFPPLRQFGVVTAGAFLLALIADFTALLSALWIARGGGASPRPS